ncbi:S41 family peptidase [Caviibacter abscessus]|uniref:S41 family peptidase n=1 Tax=Caviibacter abscessus TaxID=1766719 RepID=UPI00082A4D0E|nr:S41 family peptidase [Caviibacter abscessus]
MKNLKIKFVSYIFGSVIFGALLGLFVPKYCHAIPKTTIVEKNKKNTNEELATFNDTVELAKVIETINLVIDNWVGDKEINKDKLYKAALSGILNELEDPYSEYLSKKDLDDFNDDLNGKYSGVGMTINKKKGEYMEVISPFIGSPAYNANIQIGDRVLKINGKDILKNSAVEISKMLRGRKGTKVGLEISRKNVKNPIKVTLVRDEIIIKNIEYKMLENNIGYISLLQFGDGVGQEMENAINDLNKKGMKKIILDLRTNPGGSLKEAVDIASLFTYKNKLVSLKFKNEDAKTYTRTLRQTFNGPMVILVNGGSASASEIVTGILKDYKIATIIGEKTYGKGVAQNIVKFKTGDALKLTIAKYSTPHNDNINKNGIEPDIYIKMENILSTKGYSIETEKAKQNRQKEIEKLLIEIHGEKKAKEIINAGDIQLKAAIDYLNGKKVVSDKKEGN